MIFLAVSFEEKSIAAIFFDVDGTLYDSSIMKKKMLMKIILAAFKGKFCFKQYLMIQTYRSIHRELQAEPPEERNIPLAKYHIDLTAERLNMNPSEVHKVIFKWMRREPLSLLKSCRYEGLCLLLNELKQHCELGVFSDYPVEDKLKALGVESYFKWNLSSHDHESNGYKPRGNGFKRLCRQTNLKPEEILYIGDEMNSDILGAKTHGINAILVNRKSSIDEVTRVRHLSELKGFLLA